jgi:hypothetical protein
MWAGEFGRHNNPEFRWSRSQPQRFQPWFAGGGFKNGLVYGETDEFGYKAVENKVSVPNMQATLLYLLGLDHVRLIYPYGGRDQTPTEFSITGAAVVPGLLKNPPQITQSQ